MAESIMAAQVHAAEYMREALSEGGPFAPRGGAWPLPRASSAPHLIHDGCHLSLSLSDCAPRPSMYGRTCIQSCRCRGWREIGPLEQQVNRQRLMQSSASRPVKDFLRTN